MDAHPGHPQQEMPQLRRKPRLQLSGAPRASLARTAGRSERRDPHRPGFWFLPPPAPPSVSATRFPNRHAPWHSATTPCAAHPTSRDRSRYPRLPVQDLPIRHGASSHARPSAAGCSKTPHHGNRFADDRAKAEKLVIHPVSPLDRAWPVLVILAAQWDLLQKGMSSSTATGGRAAARRSAVCRSAARMALISSAICSAVRSRRARA